MSQVIPLRRGRLPYYSIRPPWRQAGRSASLVRGWQFGGAAPGRALVRGAWRQGAVPGTRQGAVPGRTAPIELAPGAQCQGARDAALRPAWRQYWQRFFVESRSTADSSYKRSDGRALVNERAAIYQVRIASAFSGRSDRALARSCVWPESALPCYTLASHRTIVRRTRT
jgi:hypothetical protein